MGALSCIKCPDTVSQASVHYLLLFVVRVRKARIGHYSPAGSTGNLSGHFVPTVSLSRSKATPLLSVAVSEIVSLGAARTHQWKGVKRKSFQRCHPHCAAHDPQESNFHRHTCMLTWSRYLPREEGSSMAQSRCREYPTLKYNH